MDEDEIVNALVNWHETSSREAIEVGETDANVEIFPEAHYNYYGNRGVVDLYVVTSGWDGHVYEIKSENAVRNATGANEIIRQFNRMREFFFEGSDKPRPTANLVFELCFTPTEYNARHIVDNADIYSATVSTELSTLSNINEKSIVCFRLPDPDNITPLLMFTSTFDFRELLRRDEYDDYAQSNQALYRRIGSILRNE